MLTDQHNLNFYITLSYLSFTMTKESLKQLIREIVREEIKQSLPTVLPQVIAEVFANNSRQQVIVKNEDKKPNSVDTLITKPKKEFKIYTKNELLNKVLNETVGGVPQDGSLVSSGMDSVPSVMDNIDNVPEPVSKALTRDYSSLLKAMDKKRGNITGNNRVGMM